MSMLVDVLWLLGEGLYSLIELLSGGWRFLFSKRYRATTINRWNSQALRATILELALWLVGVVASGAFVWWILVVLGQLVGLLPRRA